jgi:hypothetical protein
MYMVGHEHIRVNGTTSAGSRLREALEIKTPMDVAEEARSAIIAALSHI